MANPITTSSIKRHRRAQWKGEKEGESEKEKGKKTLKMSIRKERK